MVHRAGLREIERVVRGLERRHAAADAELETPAAHLVEHADFLDQAQRMIKRQEIDQRAEAQPVGALRQRREENSGRRRAADRRAVMLGEVIAVKARAVVSLGKPQPAGKQLAMRHACIVHVIEYAEFHRGFRSLTRPSGAGTAQPSAANGADTITALQGLGETAAKLA